MGFSRQLVIIVGLALLAAQAVLAYDPPITTDFGLVGATSGENFTSRSFELIKLLPLTPLPPVGLTLVPNFVAQYPGVTGLGIGSLYFLVDAGAEVPPHSHPRATELFYVISGTWSVGFIDTNNTLYSSNLGPGDQFIFPIGLLHYQYVTSGFPATGISVFNSQNPGVALTPNSLFASTPTILDIILANAFKISVPQVEQIKAALAH